MVPSAQTRKTVQGTLTVSIIARLIESKSKTVRDTYNGHGEATIQNSLFSAAVGRDIAGGLLADVSGIDRLLILTGRYAVLTAGAAFAVPLFLGGGALVFFGRYALLEKVMAVLVALMFICTVAGAVLTAPRSCASHPSSS